jgi:hypothetical protein
MWQLGLEGSDGHSCYAIHITEMSTRFVWIYETKDEIVKNY